MSLEYFKARLDTFPAVFQHHIQHNPDFSNWYGDLEAVSLRPYADRPRGGYTTELHLIVNKTELVYLLHPTNKTAQPFARRDISNLSKLWAFKGAVNEWLAFLSAYEMAAANTATKRFKEELMAAAWHPSRVAKWLEAGGFEALD
jgi:hypothetical protein